MILAQPGTPEPRGAHLCHWTGCTRAVAPRYWGCRVHWRRLPAEIRDAIAASYNPAGVPSDQYLAARRWALDWIATHP